MNKIEILAPAGGYDSVVAAVRNGANAVYVGEKMFSARSSAQNFDLDELSNAVKYCHIHGVKLYVTINTVVFDDEFEMLKKAIIIAATADADALIVQNLGVARLAKQLVPQMPLHASTQMSIHTYSGVKALCEMGFKRVVLSREMSKEEIKKCTQLPIELEVFVHGALCMCVSGQCYFSAMLGSRSGNRGACAQPCRLPFAVGKNKEGFALSLKDNSLISHINELENMGVTSAKIEGRMKRPEYVATVTKACCEQRDNGFVNATTQEQLRSVFSRSGFTDGYFTRKTGYEMFGTRRKSDVISADEKLFSQIRQGYKNEIQNININGTFTAKVGQSPQLQISDGANTVTVCAEHICETAINVPTTVEKCKTQLLKTGSTAYNFSDIKIDIDNNIVVPASVINLVRRNALQQLDELRSNIHHYKINKNYKIEFPQHSTTNKRKVRVRALTTKFNKEFKKCDLIFIPITTADEEIKRLISENYNIGIEIPRGMFGREETINKRLLVIKTLGVKDVLCNNLGAIYIAKQLEFIVHAGFGMNFVNTYDLLWAEEYNIKDVELSFELTFDRINRLGANIERGIISYGYLPLMLCRNCPVKSANIDCKTCKNQLKMTDRKNIQFSLSCDKFCTEVLNSVPLFISAEELTNINVENNILRFSVENYVENVNEIINFNGFPMLKEHLTRGLYVRGVK